jgi:hypothetical protein
MLSRHSGEEADESEAIQILSTAETIQRKTMMHTYRDAKLEKKWDRKNSVDFKQYYHTNPRTVPGFRARGAA